MYLCDASKVFCTVELLNFFNERQYQCKTNDCWWLLTQYLCQWWRLGKEALW